MRAAYTSCSSRIGAGQPRQFAGSTIRFMNKLPDTPLALEPGDDSADARARIENYLGFPPGISGHALAAHEQRPAQV